VAHPKMVFNGKATHAPLDKKKLGLHLAQELKVE